MDFRPGLDASAHRGGDHLQHGLLRRRLFTIEDTETAENPLLPAKWKLMARSAFNGIVLWTLDYPNWEQVTVYIKRPQGISGFDRFPDCGRCPVDVWQLQ